MKKQYKLIFAILFGFNVLLTVVGIVIGASFPTIALSISSAAWIAIHYHRLKDYVELMSTYLSVRDAHIQAAILHCKALDIIKEGLTREWASPEEFEKWQDVKMYELINDKEN